MSREARTICWMLAANIALPAYGFALAKGSTFFLPLMLGVLPVIGWGIGDGITLKSDRMDDR